MKLCLRAGRVSLHPPFLSAFFFFVARASLNSEGSLAIVDLYLDALSFVTLRIVSLALMIVASPVGYTTHRGLDYTESLHNFQVTSIFVYDENESLDWVIYVEHQVAKACHESLHLPHLCLKLGGL